VPLYGDPSGGLIDVTREMVAPFDPNEQTLSIMENLMEREPVDME